MTINKYFVFVPQQEERGMNKEHQVENEQETQRQALVKQAQQQGGVQGQVSKKKGAISSLLFYLV